MSTYAVEGIILRQRDLGESDRVFTLLTQERGKLTVVAKGLRKPQSKLKGFLQPFRHNYFELAPGKNFEIITSAETVEFFDVLATDLKRLGLAFFLAELIDQTVAEGEKVPEIFDLLLEGLKTLKKKGAKLSLLRSYCVFKLAGILGFQPELRKCLLCGKELTEKEKLFYSVEEGGLFCAVCAGGLAGTSEISPSTVKLLRLFEEERFEKMNRVRVEPFDLKVLAELSLHLAAVLTGRKLASEEFLAKISSDF